MNAKEALKEIKILLGMEQREETETKSEETIEATFTEAKLQDGTNISYDKLEIGSNFLIRTDAETSVPAPAGEYVLEDGTIVIVGDDNLITEVKMPETTADEYTDPKETVEEKPEDKPEDIEEPDEKEMRIAACEDKIKKLEEAMTMLLGSFSAMSDEFSAQSEKIEEIAKAPAAEPVHFAKQTEETKTETTAEKRLKVLAELKKNK